MSRPHLISGLLAALTVANCSASHAQSPPEDKCFKLQVDDKPHFFDYSLEEFCKKAGAYVTNGIDSDFYKLVKRNITCGSELDVDRFKINESVLFRLKSASLWQVHDLYDVVRVEQECRKSRNLPNKWDKSDQLDSMTLKMIFDTFAVDLEVQKNATVGPLSASSDDRQAIAVVPEYRHVTVTDLQIDGETMVGDKVIVQGYVDLLGSQIAVIFAHRDDTVGVDIDMHDGSREVRRYILEHCSRIERQCKLELKGTVIDDNGGTELKLD